MHEGELNLAALERIFVGLGVDVAAMRKALLEPRQVGLEVVGDKDRLAVVLFDDRLQRASSFSSCASTQCDTSRSICSSEPV